MVARGRGAKSGRCITCKQRKVKCDETRPGCLRCQLAALPCQGYYDNQTVPVNLTKPDKPTAGKIVQRSQGSRHPSLHAGLVRPLLPSEDEAATAYLLHNFSPTSHALAPSASLLPQVLATDQLSQTPMQKACLDAVATSFFGKITRNKTMFEKGQTLYSVALGQLANCVMKPRQVDDLGMARAILCLSLYENINLSSRTAWCFHYGGLSKIIHSRGPEYYKSGPNKDLLLVSRLMIILHAGMLRIPCFLAQPNWRAVAWPSQGQGNSSYEFLLGILAEVPAITYAFDRVEITHETTKLRDKTRLVLRALQTWHQNNKEDDTNLLPNDKLVTLILHHAILISLADVCRALRISLTPLGPSDRPELKEGDIAVEMLTMAEKIFQEDKSAALAILLIFPLQKASRLIVPGSEHAKRVDHVMNDIIATTCGLELGRKIDWPDQDDS